MMTVIAKYDSKSAGWAILVNGKCVGHCGTLEGAKVIVSAYKAGLR